MNLEEQRVSGLNQIHLTDALNAALLELKIGKHGSAMGMPTDFVIYVDKENKDNPTTDRKAYHFNLSSQLNYKYVELDESASDKFIVKMVIENNKVIMKTYVERYVSYDEEGNKINLYTPEIEVLDTLPIILFEGENYIYTNYTDAMSIELIYPKNTEENKMYLNSAIYYSNKGDGDFSLDDIYFKDAFTKTEDKLNLEVNNAKIDCLTSKNNKFSLDEEGNLTVNSILFNNTNSNFDPLVMYPVGSIYMSINNVSPSTLFGGTWEQIKDRFLLACGDNYSNGLTGGEAEHKLTINEIPSHEHQVVERNSLSGKMEDFWLGTEMNGNSGENKHYKLTSTSRNLQWVYSLYKGLIATSVGGNQSHNNMPPYLTVYMWKRTA